MSAKGQGQTPSRTSSAQKAEVASLALSPTSLFAMTLAAVALALTTGGLVRAGFLPCSSIPQAKQPVRRASLPPLAQVIDQKSFNVLPTVLPPTERNATTFFVPPGTDKDSLYAKPFHVYDDEFLAILGSNPTMTQIGQSGPEQLFHEAVVWYKPTDEVFFAQNAGPPAAGTGLNKSSIIQKISQADAAKVANQRNASNAVPVTVVDTNPMVLNPNGGTNYRGQLLFAGEGQGPEKESALWIVNPEAPYNSTKLVNNFFGRQFSSLNDIAIHPVNKDVYFTDTLYGYLQDFRPKPGMRNQVYRLNPKTGAVTVVADGFTLPNGLTFSPDGLHAYVTDTGINQGFWGFNFSEPSSIYRYDVQQDGTFENRKTFAFVDTGVPDGVHCDSTGNVYTGVGDGLHVYNPSGKLIGKIYVGGTSANFMFTGSGRMVICAETQLYYVTLAAEGALVESEL